VRNVIVDSPVLAGFCDPDNTLHGTIQAAVAGLLGTGYQIIVPTSVLADALADAYRITPHTIRKIEGLARDSTTTVYPLDQLVARASAEFRFGHPHLPLLAAFVFGTATVTAAHQILSADESWCAVDHRVHLLR
jgi:hypothetical protein